MIKTERDKKKIQERERQREGRIEKERPGSWETFVTSPKWLRRVQLVALRKSLPSNQMMSLWQAAAQVALYGLLTGLYLLRRRGSAHLGNKKGVSQSVSCRGNRYCWSDRLLLLNIEANAFLIFFCAKPHTQTNLNCTLDTARPWSMSNTPDTSYTPQPLS